MCPSRAYEVQVLVEHHDDSGSVHCVVSMRYEQEPFNVLLDIDDSEGQSRGSTREELIKMVRAALRFAL